MPPRFNLKPGIDTAALRAEFRRGGVVQIEPFIGSEEASALAAHLQERDDWHVTLSPAGQKAVRLTPATWQAMSAAQREALRQTAAPTREEGFHYIYRHIPVTGGDSPSNREPETLLGRFAEFLSSAPVLDLVREITGADDISLGDAQATAYGPGDHLTIHNDRRDEHHRRAAYVLGLTPRWRPEWGGLLLFHDERGDVVSGKMPRMNVLTLFDVPKSHSVSAVAPYAPEVRYSITGWFRAGG